tara:strand:- start:318 stop:590 length:273 start_codon:yes stop_codon:yes gene_type:complete
MTGQNIIQKINSFVVWVVLKIGCQLIWITLNKADRLNLLDTDERVGVMKKGPKLTRVGVVIILLELKLKGLTTGPKWSSIGISNRKDNND